MPMFIDRHDGADGVSPEEVVAGHELDLEIQGEFGVQYITYWFDPADGTVFCLAEGPSREAVEAVHLAAHGEIAPTIIEFDQEAPLNAFFGSLPSYARGTPYVESAVRSIVFTDMCGSVAQTQALGDDGHMQLLRAHNDIVRSALREHGGREVKHTGDGIMAAFTSVASSVAFAVAVQRSLDERNQEAEPPLHVSIGISAGEPVTDDSDDLFGAAVQLAARLCASASSGEIVTSVAVKELCIGKPLTFEDRGRVELKGLAEPAQTYVVSWREERGQAR
jgi:class 3 adenylate cyclase